MQETRETGNIRQICLVNKEKNKGNGIDNTGQCGQADIELNRSRPRSLAKPRLHFVILRLRTGGPSNRGIGKVHVRRHGGGVCWGTGLGVVVINRAGRRDASMRRRCPAQTGHVGTSANAVWPVVVVGRRLQRLRGAVAGGM